MKPYGNQHKFWGEGKCPMNASRFGRVHAKHRRDSRRVASKRRRSQDKRNTATIAAE